MNEEVREWSFESPLVLADGAVFEPWDMTELGALAAELVTGWVNAGRVDGWTLDLERDLARSFEIPLVVYDGFVYEPTGVTISGIKLREMMEDYITSLQSVEIQGGW